MPASAQLATTTSSDAQYTALTRVIDQWRRRARGAEYVDILRTFLKSVSPSSRQAYIRGISNFFEWHEIVHSSIPLPSEVTRERAFEYSAFLLNEPPGYYEKKLERTRPEVYNVIYRFVRAHAACHIDDIRNELLTHSQFTVLTSESQGSSLRRIRTLQMEEKNPDGLDRLLGCMANEHVIHRSPTVRDIRSGRVKLGLEDPKQAGIKYRVDPNVFSYSVPQKDLRRESRASSASHYMRTLSSFWHWLIDNVGENVGSFDPLIRFNVWTLPIRSLHKRIQAHQKVHRAETVMTMELFNRLLGTTYKRIGSDTHSLVASHNIVDVRDRAIMLFLLYVAPRKEELASLRRRDIVWSQKAPYVRITGKGLKDRVVAIHPMAYEALLELTAAFEKLAVSQEARNSGSISVARRMLEPDGPVFPPVARWGCASDAPNDNLGEAAISCMLRSRAERIGIIKNHPDYYRVHPHGFRHLAARTASMAGTPIPVIQACLGHTNLSTTSIYTESHDPKNNILFGWQPTDVAQAQRAEGVTASGPVIAPVAPPDVPEPVRKPQHVGPVVIETTGKAVREPEPELRQTGTFQPAKQAPVSRQSVPVHAEERLVQVGEVAPAAPGGPVISRDDPISQLERMYSQNWGEPGERQAIGPGELSKVYAGTKTGLVWWTGTTGALKPELPVMGPMQVAGFDGSFGSVRESLESLWHRWRGGQDRGPTAASALLSWIRDALETASATSLSVERRGGRWMPHDWPLRLSALKEGELRRSFRLHRDDMIADWFARHAWQHRLSRGRTGAAGERVSRVIDTRPDLPDWYGSADPLSDLSPSDRAELADWLLALTGKPPVDRTQRFQGASRRDLAGVIGLLCEYDDRVDELKELGRASAKDRDAISQVKEDVRVLADTIKQRVAVLTNNRVPSFDIEAVTRARSQETRRAVTKETGPAPESVVKERSDELQRGHERRRDFYLRVLGDLFGKSAADDEFLRIFALCSRGTPLGEGFYRDLFRFEKGTIVHTPEFQTRFAKDTGAHSECVARRMARELWELRKKHLASIESGGRGERIMSRSDELVETLDSMAAYRVPCPEALEKELQLRLGSTNRQPVYEEWERYKQHALPTTREEERESERAETVGEIMAEAQEKHREDIAREFARAKESEYTANARRYVPGPVLLLFSLYTR